jgi:flagellar hook-basal body complex protein FliE
MNTINSVNLKNTVNALNPQTTSKPNGPFFRNILNDVMQTQNNKTPLPINLPFASLTQIMPEKIAPQFAQVFMEDEIKRAQKKNSRSRTSAQQINQISHHIQQPSRLINDRSNDLLLAQAPATPTDPTAATAAAAANQPAQLDPTPVAPEDPLSVENVYQESLRSSKLEITPFQLFMEKAGEALDSLSTLEVRVNDLMDQYMAGKVSIEEVSTETAKLNLAVTFVSTVISQVTTTFKEIQNLPV